MKFQKDFKLVFCLIAVLVSASFAAAQDTLTKPYNFSPGTTASSGQVNANFDALYQKINELSGKVAALEAGGGGSLPPADYDSGWFDVAPGITYKKSVGFTGLPKLVTAYYKRPNGQILVWGLSQATYSDTDGFSTGIFGSGVILDFDESGSLYVRSPSGNTYNSILYALTYRNRNSDANETIGETAAQFKVLLWK